MASSLLGVLASAVIRAPTLRCAVLCCVADFCVRAQRGALVGWRVWCSLLIFPEGTDLHPDAQKKEKDHSEKLGIKVRPLGSRAGAADGALSR